MQGAGNRTICRGKPGSKSLYLTCELDNTVRILSYKNDSLNLVVAYKVSQNVNNFPAEVQYLNNRVYVSLRGDNKALIFDEKDGKLQQNCSFKVGDWPRYFKMTPEGYMYVTCQYGNLVQKFKIAEDKITLLS